MKSNYFIFSIKNFYVSTQSGKNLPLQLTFMASQIQKGPIIDRP